MDKKEADESDVKKPIPKPDSKKENKSDDKADDDKFNDSPPNFEEFSEDHSKSSHTTPSKPTQKS